MKKLGWMATVSIVSTLLFSAGCADKDPPVWPDDADILAEVKGGDVWLSWPDAKDSGKIAKYSIYRGAGELVAELKGDAGGHTIHDLEGMTEYLFSVKAMDEAGNVSAPLEKKVKTRDATPPKWKEQAFEANLLDGKEGEAPTVRFSWSAAEDNVGVETYRLSKGDEEQPRMDSTHLQTEVSGGALEGEWTLSACDLEDNCTEALTCEVDLKKLAAKREMASNGILKLLGAMQLPEVFKGDAPASGVGALLSGSSATGGLGLSGLPDVPAGGLGLGELREMDESLAKDLEDLGAEKKEEK